MKSLIAIAFMIVSSSTFAKDLGAVDSLLKILPLGTYQGANDAGVACTLTVNEVNFPAKAVTVTGYTANTKIFKVVNDESEFLFRENRNEFIQTERQYIDSTRNSFVERIIRTVNADDNRLYVVVANELTVNRERTVEAVECVVNVNRN